MDDVILYRRSAERFLMIVNAANIEKDLEWLQSQEPSECELRDVSDAYALLALQGPRSESILQALTPIDLSQLKFYRFVRRGGRWPRRARGPHRLHRRGRLRAPGRSDEGPGALAGRSWQRAPRTGWCRRGLGARDTLRLEAGCCCMETTWTRRRHWWRPAWAGSSPSTMGRATSRADRSWPPRRPRRTAEHARRLRGGGPRDRPPRLSGLHR